METWGNYEDRIEYSLRILIDLFDRYQVKATFFVLGDIAKKHPDLIAEIARQGHEIGSHGSFHKLVYKQTEKEFREDVRQSKQTLEDIIGKPVEIFRASTWSISKDTLWALRILQEEGFRYDSSIQPFQTYLSGMKHAPVYPFYPVIQGEKLDILEFPPTVYRLGKFTIPFAGGFYLRAVPLPLIKRFLHAVNKTREGLLYIHPWEVDDGQPRLKVPPHVQLSHYHHVKQNARKIERLLQHSPFMPIGELVKGRNYPSVEL